MPGGLPKKLLRLPHTLSHSKIGPCQVLLIVIWQDHLAWHLSVAIEVQLLRTVIALFIAFKTSRQLYELRSFLSGEQLLHDLKPVWVNVFAG